MIQKETKAYIQQINLSSPLKLLQQKGTIFKGEKGEMIIYTSG